MDPSFIISIVVLAAMLVCSAFFSSSETALFALNTLQVRRMRRTHPAAAERLEIMLGHPIKLLSTILIGNTVINVCGSALAFSIASRLFPKYGEAVAIVGMTTLLVLFGEVAPKRIAMAHPEKLARLYQPILWVLIPLMKPFRIGLEVTTTFLREHFGGKPGSLTEDEFRSVAEVAEEEGVLDEEERTMVDGIIRLEETQVSDVMTPRVDLVGLDLDDDLETHVATARSVTFRYLPVYRGSLDEPRGLLEVPKFLLSGATDMKASMLEPFFVPETAPLDSLLTTFISEHRRAAFVADEYGGTAGLITRGDILEEITPDVDNEYGEEKFVIQEIRPKTWLIEGSTSLEDINYEIGVELEAEGADRISGWVSAQAERIPRTGDVVEAQGCRVTVQRSRRNRVLLVQLELLPEPELTVEDSDDD